MKKIIPYLLFLLLCAVINLKSYSQISVVSSTGYTVNIVIHPKEIVPTSTNCTWGYNYNVKLEYSITFTGNNIPSSLYTLQGTLGCGSSTHFFQLPKNSATGTLTTQSNVWRSQSDCATANLSSLFCNTVNLSIQGPGINNHTITFPVTAIPTPIKLVDFTAEALKEKVKLQWSTATETNNDYFTIERSTDGSSWTEVKKIKGAENSVSLLNYEYFDENPISGTSYYRLKQTDLDGKATYSVTRSIKYSAGNIYVYPVPNTGNTINFKGISEPKNILMTVHDITGASIFSTGLSSNSVQLPTTIKAGMYVISLTNDVTGEITNLRYIKM